MKKQKILLKKSNGITLIGLVITSIVLLIMSGITITTLTGENGLMQNATDAKDETVKKSIQEELLLAVLESKLEQNGSFVASKAKAKILSLEGATANVNSTNNTISGTYKDYNYNIDNTGLVTVGDKVSNEIVVGDTYEISSGSQKYHGSLASAINSVPDGGTVKLLKNSTETGNVTINKNVTINTNGKVLTRTSGSIIITNGTVTISGTGTIRNTATSGIAFSVRGGTFKTSGGTTGPTLQARGTVIDSSGSSVVNVAGGYIYSTEGNALVKSGSGALNISNTYVYAKNGAYNAIWYKSGGSGTTTIGGSSVIGSGDSRTSGSPAPTIKYCSSGRISVTGTSKIIAGPYASQFLWVESTGCVVQLIGSSEAYMNNNNGILDGIYVNSNGVNVLFNSTGWFYSCGTSVLSSNEINTITLNVIKGHFVSKNTNGYMFYKGGGWMTQYRASGAAGTRTFYVMTGYRNVVEQSYSGCYYYTIGV